MVGGRRPVALPSAEAVGVHLTAARAPTAVAATEVAAGAAVAAAVDRVARVVAVGVAVRPARSG